MKQLGLFDKPKEPRYRPKKIKGPEVGEDLIRPLGHWLYAFTGPTRAEADMIRKELDLTPEQFPYED